MALVINLYGGPGTGKSTTASGVFNRLKKAGINAEYVQEYVKQWAWEERKPVSYDQFYFFGKQARKEYSLFKNVDVIITDSPVSLCAYYTALFGNEKQAELFKGMTRNYYEMVAKENNYIHFWLKRVKPYNPKGRFQTEDEAKKIDEQMKTFIAQDLGIGEIFEVNADDSGEDAILEHVLKLLK